jgi:single-strand DNA-binding protein
MADRSGRPITGRRDFDTMAHTTVDTNDVRLTGRIPAAPEERELPSGDTVWIFRVVVRRPEGAGRTATIDTVDCAAYGTAAVRSVRTWRPGDVVAIDGALRRRFWRTPAGPRSRYEVEVSRARRVAKAA